MSRSKKCVLAVLAAALSIPIPAFSQERAEKKEEEGKIAARANQVRGDEITQAQQAAVEKGLA